MVLRNPYGYLIKHFKLIHLILVGLYIYLAMKVNSITTYLNHFLDGTVGKLDAINYVNQFYMVAVVLSIIICICIYILLRYKKKPRLLYILLIGLYVIVPTLISLSYGVLEIIYSSVMDTKTILLYRDLFRILILFQYASIVVVLFRGLGFDIKKFDFAGDLIDLNLTEHDMEEIELSIGEAHGVDRKIHRRVRELKYYYLENKVFISIFFLIVIVASIVGIVLNVEVINKKFKEGETFSLGNYQLMVSNTFVTSRDVHNNDFLLDNGHTFVVVRMLMASSGTSKFNTSGMLLRIGNKNYSSDSKYASRFSDLGYAYRDNRKVKGQGSYIFIFDVDSSLIHNDMILDYAGEKTVMLSPIFLDEVNKETEYHVGDTINFSSSPLGRGNFAITEVDIKEKFSYAYEYDVMGKKNTANLTISSSDNNIVLFLKIKSSLFGDYTDYSFLNEFGKLKYKIDDDVLTSNVSDKTPKSYGGGVYLAVDKDISQASKIWYEIIIRNCKYKYYIK